MKNAPAVWLGRPKRRAAALAEELKKLGIRPEIKPALKILAAKNPRTLKQFAESPNRFDMAIFTGEEAAFRLQKLPPPKNAAKVRALAVGPATLRALKKLPGLAPENAPAGDSDSLLAAPQLRAENIRGQKIAVLGGTTGGGLDSLSPYLRAELQKRGALVFPVAAYRRMPPPPAPEIAALAANKTLRAAVAYSGETAAAMLAMCAPDNADVKRLPLFVIHPRIAAAAKTMGWQNAFSAPAEPAEMARQIARHLRAGGI